MKLSTFLIVLAFMAALAGTVNATPIASYTFEPSAWVEDPPGTWTPQPGMDGWSFTAGAGLPAPQWLHWAPPGNFGVLSFNHEGNPGGSYALSPLITVADGQEYALTFDYATTAQTQSVNVHFYDTAGVWKAVGTTAYDEWAWGVPSLTVTSPGTEWIWRTKSLTFNADAADYQIGYISLQAIHGATWGQTFFDNFTVTATPEPATVGLLGLGALGLFRKKRA